MRSSSAAAAHTTILLFYLLSHSPVLAVDSAVDHGPSYGNVVIRNHCDYTLYLHSVGAHLMATASIDDGKLSTIEPHTVFTEPFRETCHWPGHETDDPALPCPASGKLDRSGPSLKIGKQPNTNEITQFEYALTRDEKRGDTFYRLNYDVSLLDCAKPPEGQAATDFQHTPEQHQNKLEKCPGYAGGLAVSFTNKDVQCPPITCTGKEACKDIYIWDPTRKDEMSLACEQEYHGDMILDLCWDGTGTPPSTTVNSTSPLSNQTASYHFPTPTPTAQPVTIPPTTLTTTVIITQTAIRPFPTTLRTTTRPYGTRPTHSISPDLGPLIPAAALKPFVQKMLANMGEFVGQLVEDVIAVFAYQGVQRGE